MKVDSDLLDQVVRPAMFAADTVAMDRSLRFLLTEAERTRRIVRRALEVLLVNGFIEVVDPDQWPDFFNSMAEIGDVE